MESMIPMEKKKKKIKAQSFRKMKDDITQVDSQTYYVKGSMPEPYMIFHSNNGKWLCDCMDYVIHIEDNGTIHDCKHILRIKKQYNL